MPGCRNADTLGADDFQLHVGNSNDPTIWAEGAAKPGVTVRRGAGSGGSDRITLIWPDNLIESS